MKKVTKDSRIIHALLPQREKVSKSIISWSSVAGWSTIAFSLSVTVTVGILLHNTLQMYNQEVAEKKIVIQNLDYWQGVVNKHPHFPAAYYEAAVYAARLEDREKAKDFLQKALTIDPNFFEAEALAKELE